jgi:hypothetical protein
VLPAGHHKEAHESHFRRIRCFLPQPSPRPLHLAGCISKAANRATCRHPSSSHAAPFPAPCPVRGAYEYEVPMCSRKNILCGGATGGLLALLPIQPYVDPSPCACVPAGGWSSHHPASGSDRAGAVVALRLVCALCCSRHKQLGQGRRDRARTLRAHQCSPGARAVGAATSRVRVPVPCACLQCRVSCLLVSHSCLVALVLVSVAPRPRLRLVVSVCAVY